MRRLIDGRHTLFARARDAAGNWGPVRPVVLPIDRTAPEACASAARAGRRRRAVLHIRERGSGLVILRYRVEVGGRLGRWRWLDPAARSEVKLAREARPPGDPARPGGRPGRQRDQGGVRAAAVGRRRSVRLQNRRAQVPALPLGPPPATRSTRSARGGSRSCSPSTARPVGARGGCDKTLFSALTHAPVDRAPVDTSVPPLSSPVATCSSPYTRASKGQQRIRRCPASDLSLTFSGLVPMGTIMAYLPRVAGAIPAGAKRMAFSTGRTRSAGWRHCVVTARVARRTELAWDGRRSSAPRAREQVVVMLRVLIAEDDATVEPGAGGAHSERAGLRRRRCGRRRGRGDCRRRRGIARCRNCRRAHAGRRRMGYARDLRVSPRTERDGFSAVLIPRPRRRCSTRVPLRTSSGGTRPRRSLRRGIERASGS